MDNTAALAALENIKELEPEMRELVRDHWISELVPAIFGQIEAGERKPGLVDEFRDFKKWAFVGGSIAGAFTISLQFIQTFGLAQTMKHALVILFGGHS